MVPKMLLHVENVLNYLEDPDYRNELSKVVGKYISANIDAVCEEVSQLMVLDNVISENIITEIVRLKPSHAGQILSDWCMKSEKNIIFIFDNKAGFNLRSIFPDAELFQSFIKVLMSKVDALGMDGMKQIVDLQNSYYTRALQKQLADKMSSPERVEEEVKKSKIDLSINKQESCSVTTKEQKSKLKNSTKRVNQLTSKNTHALQNSYYTHSLQNSYYTHALQNSYYPHALQNSYYPHVLQNSHYTHALQKQQADKMSSPKRDEEEVKKSKIDLSINKQESCSATTKEQKSKLKNSTERVNQLTSKNTHALQNSCYPHALQNSYYPHALQNSHYTHALQKQQADKMSSPKRDEEEVKKLKIDLNIGKQESCCASTKEQKSKLKNSIKLVHQLTSEIRKNKSNQKPDKLDDRSLEEETGAVPKELLDLARLKPQRHQQHKFFSDIFLRSRVWQSYSFTDTSDLSQNVAISCYTFMDLMIEWLRTHQTPEKKFNILWGNMNIKRLSYTFILDLKDHLKSNCGLNLSKLPQKKDFETTNDTEILSKTVTVKEFKKLTSRQVIHLSISKCPVVGCKAPSTVKFYVMLQLCNECPAVLPQAKVDQSQIVLGSGHLHPDNVVHWYAVINDTNCIIPLNLTPVDKLEQKLTGASNVTVKCVISCNGMVRGSNNSKETNLTELRKIEMLTLPSYQLSQSIEDLLRTKFIGISPYQYIELCTQWIESRKPKKDLFDVILSSFPIDKVSKEFMNCIDLKLTSLTYTINYPKMFVPISTAELNFDVNLVDPFRNSDKNKSGLIDFTFKSKNNYEYTVTVRFFSSAPLVRVQNVILKPRISSYFIRVCHIYFKTVSSRGNSSFVSIMSNNDDEFKDALISRKRCYIYFDYYMPARVTT